MKKIELHEKIFLVEDFLSREECEDLIMLSEKLGYGKAKVNSMGHQVQMLSVRDNDRVLHFDHEIASYIWKRLKSYVPMPEACTPIGLNELIRFYRYHPGQRFKKHKDGSFVRNGREQSLDTVLIYLNDGFEGGETRFGNEMLEVKPRQGMALVFEHDILHEGCATASGVKYVLRTDIMYRLGAE